MEEPLEEDDEGQAPREEDEEQEEPEHEAKQIMERFETIFE